MLCCQAQSLYKIKLIILLVLLTGITLTAVAQETDIIDFDIPSNLEECENATFICKATPSNAFIWWDYEGRNLTNDSRYTSVVTNDVDVAVSSLILSCVTADDIGNYTCNVGSEGLVKKQAFFDVHIKPEIYPGEDVKVNATSKAVLSCEIKGHPIENIIWSKDNVDIDSSRVDNNKINTTLLVSRLNFQRVSRNDNGTYFCRVFSKTGEYSGQTALIIYDQPQINLDVIEPVGMDKIFVNWTVNNGNLNISKYQIQYMENGTNSWLYWFTPINASADSYIISNLKANTAYKIKLTCDNEFGSAVAEQKEYVETLSKDPFFVPLVLIKGVTQNSINIGWTSPPMDIRNHVHYYNIKLIHDKDKAEAVEPANELNSYLFEQLTPASKYKFQVAACSEYLKECGNWSEIIEGTTYDGESEEPQHADVRCKSDVISKNCFVFVSWKVPAVTNGNIVRYNVNLEGNSKFINEKGELVMEAVGPKAKSVNSDSFTARFDQLSPNTNYTVKISAVTRARANGKAAVAHCHMHAAIPDRDKMSHFSWSKVEEQGRWIFKLNLPRVTERNGPICCYRVVVIKLGVNQNVADLPPPEDITLSSYDEVHLLKEGAYIAEIFHSESLINEVFVGDKKQSSVDQCRTCLHTPQIVTTEAIPILVVDPIIIDESNNTNETPNDFVRAKRSVVSDLAMVHVQDGLLELNSNYTAFVQIIVYGENSSLLSTYSNYLVPLKAGPTVVLADDTSQLKITIIKVVLGIVFVIVFFIVLLCFLHKISKANPAVQEFEMSLRNSFRHILCNKGYTEVEMSMVCGGRQLCQTFRGNRHAPVEASPPDMAPIRREDMVTAFAERHRDSDYGFQSEFEQLPDRFPDRTTRSSEARENMYKNRYPDIKAYDQTRVKLAVIEDAIGSDYINANFVIGYKERKKFICAQGPMENTASDFWRMIWEQNLELVLMLTNLEEYSKTKCAKYWPDEGEKCYGEISVTHVSEKKYADYCIKELKISRENADKEKEERKIVHYHFVSWKDFAAPEYASVILKFIKRINEVYSLEKGPILVHCSAGVGRTGTFVALDSMTQQLMEEGEVSVFNTVCDLRHQRNFLVQNLKQYIFIYKALMELAQYGDTEFKLSKLKTTMEKLKQKDSGKETSKLDEEFEKLSKISEEPKPCTVGNNEENKIKNRNESVIPYDRNRVILAPISSREGSAYINASFIDGYDNMESFIITQDPLENTIPDFWRMIFEHCIGTLVMLSDLGDGPRRCQRYWPEDEITHGNVKIKYIQSESCPYYTRREFTVSSIKTEETITVTQFQYNGWPTVEGEVPEVTRGLLELVDQTRAHQDSIAVPDTKSTIAVHCNNGAERSFIFVALAILIQQARAEKRIDVFSTARKLKAQRQGMLQNFAQYEILYRALVNYIDLHHLNDEE